MKNPYYIVWGKEWRVGKNFGFIAEKTTSGWVSLAVWFFGGYIYEFAFRWRHPA